MVPAGCEWLTQRKLDARAGPPEPSYFGLAGNRHNGRVRSPAPGFASPAMRVPGAAPSSTQVSRADSNGIRAARNAPKPWANPGIVLYKGGSLYNQTIESPLTLSEEPGQ